MSRRILLIEDEPLAQEVIAAMLTGRGDSVDIVTDGFAALDRIRGGRYDVALVDYHLPDMDGYALARLLQGEAGSGPAPVLIGLTGDRNGLAARRGSDSVFRTILAKPIKPAELFSAIDRACGADAGQPDAAVPDPRAASLSLWAGHGLPRRPRALVCPAPLPGQEAALSLCFDLVAADTAEIVLLLERHGIEAARCASRRDGGTLPIVSLSADHAELGDLSFTIDDGDSWRRIAVALGATPARPVRLQPPSEPAPVTGQPAPAVEPGPQSGLRNLIVEGVQVPLAALRVALLEKGADGDAIAALDGALLVCATIADALVPIPPRVDADCVFDPAELARATLDMIRDSRPPGAMRLDCRVEPGTPRLVRADATRLREILLALLDDACTGSPKQIASLQVEHRDGLLAFDIACAALVPSSGVLAQLRALRLDTLARLAGLMGGALVSSAGGDRMRLAIPARIEAEASAGADVPGARILLVDAGGTSGQVLTMLLARKGHIICRVGDVDAALVACGEGFHDLALFDVGTGDEARSRCLAAVRCFQAARIGVPSVVLAQGLSGHEDALLDASGVAGTLAKPFTPEALDEAIAATRRHPSAQSVPAPIDTGVHGALVEALGAATVERLTGELIAQIEAATAPTDSALEPPTARLAELSGCATVLGLTELAAGCATAEAAAIRAAMRRLRAA